MLLLSLHSPDYGGSIHHHNTSTTSVPHNNMINSLHNHHLSSSSALHNHIKTSEVLGKYLEFAMIVLVHLCLISWLLPILIAPSIIALQQQYFCSFLLLEEIATIFPLLLLIYSLFFNLETTFILHKYYAIYLFLISDNSNLCDILMLEKALENEVSRVPN